MSKMKTYKAQLALIPFALLVIIIVWLLTSCEGAKYLTNTNFYKLRTGMTERDFLEWIKPNEVAVNGRPSSVKMFHYNGEEWKVYVFSVYSVQGASALFDHYEYAAFVNQRLAEYGTGSLPITLRQNPNSYEYTIKQR